jgi:ribosomal protein S18 acetylase RimI-like enzyme
MDDAPVEIRVGSEVSRESLRDLYDSVGWTAYTAEDRGLDLPGAVKASTYAVTAWRDENLVGLARGLSDDVSVFFLQDILVRPEFQGRGIGRRLLQNCLERFGHVRTRILLTDDDERQQRFYESMGFRNLRDSAHSRLNVYIQFNETDMENEGP